MSYILPLIGGKWRVAHGKNGFADIVGTRNMDFNKDGSAVLAQQPIVLYTSDDDSNFGKIQAIVLLDSVYYIITVGNVFAYTPGTGAIVEQTTSGSGTYSVYSDAVSYLGLVAVSGSTTVHSYNGSAWTSRITGLSSTPHPMCVFENLVTLCVAQGNIVYQSNTGAWTEDTANKLTLPSDQIVTWMRWRGNNMYIGTRNTSGKTAYMYVWNGRGTQFQAGYPIGCDWVYSGVDFQDTMVVLTSEGQLLRFNGGGFNEIAHFPVYETNLSWSINSASTSTIGRCANRGMVAAGDIIYLNIDGGIQDGLEGYPGKYLHDQPSGLWVYDPSVGLYHKSGSNYTKFNTLTITALSSNVLTVGKHSCETGDEIRAVSVSNITGLTVGRDYFVIKVSETTFKLAFSPGDALAGRAITLSGSPSGDTLNVSLTDCGSTCNTIPGAVAIYSQNVQQRFFGSDVLFGAQVNNNANTAVKVLMSLGTGRNIGSFTTTEFQSSGVRDVFQKLFFEIKEIIQGADSAVVKWRKVITPGLPTPVRYSDSGLGTWVDASTFTVLTTTKDFMSASVGDEIQIVEGAGSGHTAHITSIDSSTSTYSVIIDEVIPNIVPGDTSEIMVENWQKLGTIDNTTDSINEDYAELPVGEKGSWIQFKIELRGHNISVNKTSVITGTDKPPK